MPICPDLLGQHKVSRQSGLWVDLAPLSIPLSADCKENSSADRDGSEDLSLKTEKKKEKEHKGEHGRMQRVCSVQYFMLWVSFMTDLQLPLHAHTINVLVQQDRNDV